ncbi:hypothetical protein PENTCL1PPCAC_24654, partial [Pristionchus entomophagus]
MTYDVIDQLRNKTWSMVDINKGKQFNTSRLDQQLAKEAADYWRCLNLTRDSEVRYTLVLEDDVTVHPRLRPLIGSLIRQMDMAVDEVDYAKLYHPNQLRGISRLPQIMAVSLLLSFLLHSLLSP